MSSSDHSNALSHSIRTSSRPSMVARWSLISRSKYGWNVHAGEVMRSSTVTIEPPSSVESSPTALIMPMSTRPAGTPRPTLQGSTTSCRASRTFSICTADIGSGPSCDACTLERPGLLVALEPFGPAGGELVLGELLLQLVDVESEHPSEVAPQEVGLELVGQLGQTLLEEILRHLDVGDSLDDGLRVTERGAGAEDHLLGRVGQQEPDRLQEASRHPTSRVGRGLEVRVDVGVHLQLEGTVLEEGPPGVDDLEGHVREGCGRSGYVVRTVLMVRPRGRRHRLVHGDVLDPEVPGVLEEREDRLVGERVAQGCTVVVGQAVDGIELEPVDASSGPLGHLLHLLPSVGQGVDRGVEQDAVGRGLLDGHALRPRVGAPLEEIEEV